MGRCDLSKKPPRARGKRWADLCNRVDASDAEHHRTVIALLGLHMAGRIDLRQPTKYRPGTKEKVAVMAARFALGSLRLDVEGDIDVTGAFGRNNLRMLDRATFADCEIREVPE